MKIRCLQTREDLDDVITCNVLFPLSFSSLSPRVLFSFLFSFLASVFFVFSSSEFGFGIPLIFSLCLSFSPSL